MGWLGAIAGGAESANDVIDNRLKSITEEETRQGVLKKETELARIRDQIDAEKEQRVQEAEIAREGRKEEIDIRQEDRTYENAIKTRNENYDFNSSPERQKKLSEARMAGQQVEDQYKDERDAERFPIELEQKKQLFEATDTIDYDQRQLDHEKTQIEIDKALTASTDLSDREKKALEIYAKDYQNTYDTINKRVEGGTLNPNSEEYVAATTDLYNKKQSIDALLGIETKPFKPGEDYAGIRTKEEKSKSDPEKKKTGLLDAVGTLNKDFNSKPASVSDRETAIRAKVKADIEKKKSRHEKLKVGIEELKSGAPVKQLWEDLNRKPTRIDDQYSPQSKFETDDSIYNRILKEELSR